jgi:transglutaminase-like putative cysteine protease
MNLRLTVSAAIATIAASIALRPLIGSGSWFWAGAGAVIVVAGAASLTRLRTLPILVCLVVTAFGLLLYLNVVFAARYSFLGVLPTRASLTALHRLNDNGWSDAARYAPPVPGLPGITFLAVTGIGLAALVTDLLAVRLRKAAAAGLPLLALFSATVASKASASAVGEALIFCIGVAGYLVLLVADGRERIQLWGRLVSVRSTARVRPATPEENAGPDTHALAAAGRRVGMAAVAAALLIPLLVPGLHVRDLFGSGPGAGGGPSTDSLAMLPRPLDQLSHELHDQHPQPILNYKSDNPDPPYLQVYSLELGTTSTATWTLGVQQERNVRRSGQLPASPGLTNAPYRVIHTRVTIANGVKGAVANGDHTQNFLPLPYPAVNVRVASDWQVDPNTLMMWSVNSISGLKYDVTSKDIEPTAAELRAASAPPAAIGANTSLPPGYKSLGKLARQLTRGASTPYDEAVKLQQWFTTPGNFTYTLSASEPDSASGLTDFLLHSKRGYCQQFAFAFAVLARLLGIPARVAVGYTQGTYQTDGSWLVTTSDAHAWPELYFQGTGWLAWEPTPGGGAPGQGTATPPPYTIQAGTPTGSGGTSAPIGGAIGGAQPGGSSTSGAGAHVRTGPLGGNAASGGVHQHRGQWRWWLAGIALLALIILLMPMGSRVVTRVWRSTRAAARGRTPRASSHAAWQEVRDDLEDFGVSCPPNESSRATIRRVTAKLQLAASAADALRRLALAEERARYASSTDGLPTIPALHADVTAVRRALAAAVSPRTRWRARMFPASKISAMRRSAQGALDVFGWVDVATSSLWAHIRPGRNADAGGTATP